MRASEELRKRRTMIQQVKWIYVAKPRLKLLNVEVVSRLIVVVVEKWRRRGGQEEDSGGGDKVE
jgi:hypothetical protein